MSLSRPSFSRSANSRIKLSSLPSDQKTQIEDDQETVLDLTPEFKPYDESGKNAYKKACKKLGVVPSSQYIRTLTMSDTASLGHYGLGPTGTIAVCIPLVINMRITNLDLSNNNLGLKGMEYVRKMMCENDVITSLNLSDNNLGPESVLEISYLLRCNSSLRRLDLSGNQLRDENADILLQAVEENIQLKYLNLSANNFCENCGKSFKNFLAENCLLEELDLSWNKIRRNGAIEIAEGLKDNRGLTTLNLSWNGFEDEGAVAMGTALTFNKSLETLDLTCNRIGPEGFLKLTRCIKDNESLTTLKVGKNFITEDTVVLTLRYLTTLSDLALKTLDVTGVIFNKETAEEEMRSIKEIRPDFSCIYGYESNTTKKKPDFEETMRKILSMITSYLELTNKSFADLFVDVDTDGSMSVSREEFKEGLRKALIPISPYQLDELVRYLDKDNDGEVDFSELVFMT